MATTRFIPMHISKGQTIAQSLKDRFDYGRNPDKTKGGEFITAYECDPVTADVEFTLAKAKYKAITGREQKADADVITYQKRQSFEPGENNPGRSKLHWLRARYALDERPTRFHCNDPYRQGSYLMLYNKNCHPILKDFDI